MAHNRQSGFTMIETILFLGVSGALAASILVGSGVLIGQQRYKDTLNSFELFVQDQYAQTTSPMNSRKAAASCGLTGGAAKNPGRSNCMVMGRLITIDASGQNITAANIIGYKASVQPAKDNDNDELATYTFTTAADNKEVNQVAWGGTIVKPKTTVPTGVTIAIVRSPLTGAPLTYTATGTVTNIGSMINAGNTGVRDICVSPPAGTFVGKRMEIRIAAKASSQSAVQIPLESESVCD